MYEKSSYTIFAALNILLPILLGTSAFFLILGPHPLGVSNPNWFPSDDPIQAWLGWTFFRQTPWSFPPGLNPAYGLDMGNSIVYTDSIPLLAIIFKAFSPYLPKYFQYAGPWLLGCFILQAWFGWKLIARYTSSVTLRSFACVIFIFSPALLMRLYGHFTLVGQFLILAALYLCLARKNNQYPEASQQSTGYSIQWLFLLCVCSLVHAYLLAMCGILWLADFVDRVFADPSNINIRHDIAEISITISSVIFCCWLAGYFVISPGGQGGFGYYKMNLLSPVDADDSSFLINNIYSGPGEWEGFNYLGTGVLLLALFTLPPLIRGKIHILAMIRNRYALVASLIFMFVFAITYNINIGSYEIILPHKVYYMVLLLIAALPIGIYGKMYFRELAPKKATLLTFILVMMLALIFIVCVAKYNQSTLKSYGFALLQNFRSSGRFFWPLNYMLVLSIIYIIITSYKKSVAGLLLACALVIQVGDSARWWMQFSQRQSMFLDAVQQKLSSPFWKEAAHKYDKIRTLSFVNMGNDWEMFGPYAAKYGLGTDLAYFSRLDEKNLNKIYARNDKMLATGKYDPDTFYIVNEQIFNKAKQNVTDRRILMEKIDGFYVIAPGWYSD